MQRLLREPLLHFLILGALLFALYGWVGRDASHASDEIVVDQARVDALSGQFGRIWQRQPSHVELQGLIDGWVREEILYREGVSSGLERDDEVVRRRVVQKMDFMIDGMATEMPEEAQLDAWLRAHPDRYRVAPVYTLRQVYFDPGRHGGQLDDVIADVQRRLARDPQAEVGDATLLPATLRQASAEEVSRTFGQRFVDGLSALPVDQWSGPIPSGFGLHLVWVEQRSAGRLPALAEVRQAVERDVLNDRAQRASEAFYRQLRQRYGVRQEGRLDVAGRDGSKPLAANGDVAGAQ